MKILFKPFLGPLPLSFCDEWLLYSLIAWRVRDHNKRKCLPLAHILNLTLTFMIGPSIM